MLPVNFESFIPEYGDYRNNLRNDQIRLPLIRCEYGETYDNMIKYYIRNAKNTYFHNTFAMYKNGMKKTWAVTSETLNKNKKGKMSLYHLNAMVVI